VLGPVRADFHPPRDASPRLAGCGAFVLIYMALNWLVTPASPALAAPSFVHVLLLMFPITADFSAFSSGAPLFALLSVAAMAAFRHSVRR